MKLGIYDIKDTLTGFKEQVYTAVNDGEALRTFELIATSEGSYVNAYAKDIDLYKIGILDTQTGKVEGFEGGPEYMVNAKTVKDSRKRMEERENEIRKQIQSN